MGRQLESPFKLDIPGSAGLWRFPENSEEGKKKKTLHQPTTHSVLTSQIPGALQGLGWPECQDPCPAGHSSAHRELEGWVMCLCGMGAGGG